MTQEYASKIATLALKVIAAEQNNGNLDRDGIMAATGVVFSTVQRWKDGTTVPAPRDMARIAEYVSKDMVKRLLEVRELTNNLLLSLETKEENEQANK